MTDRCDDPSAGPYTDTPGKKIAPCLMTGDLMPPVEAFQDRSELAAGDGERRRRTGSLPLETPIHRKTEPSRSAPCRTDSGKSGFPPVVPVPNFSDPASGKRPSVPGLRRRAFARRGPSRHDRATGIAGNGNAPERKRVGKIARGFRALPDPNVLIAGTRRHRHPFRAVLFRLEEDEYGKKNVNLTAHRHPIRCNEP